MIDLVQDIKEQPDILLENREVIGKAYEQALDWVGDESPIVMTGMATSYYAWHSAGILLRRRAAPATIVEASEYLHYGDAERDDRPLLILSRSGETVEIVRLLEKVRHHRVLIGLTEGTANTLARRSRFVLSYTARERAALNTKSFVLSLSLALAFTAGLSGRSDLAPGHWLSRLGRLVSELVSQDLEGLEVAARHVAKAGVTLVVARGHLLGVAKNGAVDLQEGTRLPVIPISGGLLRHGPLELTLRPDSTVVFLVPDDHLAPMMLRAAAEIAGYGANVVAIAAEDIALPANVTPLRLPHVELELSPVIFAVALQLLNVGVARALGLTTISPSSITKVTRIE